jgi:hypothetical protein
MGFSRLLIIVLLLLATLAAASSDERDAHRRGDEVLYLRLVAALNEYALAHGSFSDPGHFQKLNAKDVENIRAVRETFTAWNEAMKEAGYR